MARDLNRIGALAAAIFALLLAALAPGRAEGLELQSVGNFTNPIFVTSDPADPDRLLVAERAGVIRLVTPTSNTVFADLTSLVSCCSGERGLFSIALARDYPATGRFFVAYSRRDDPMTTPDETGDIRVDEMHAGSATPRRLLEIEHTLRNNHYGGQLQVGPESGVNPPLYISVGDGGGAGDPDAAGQDLGTLLGKVLRIIPNPDPGASPSYTLPADNPFLGGPRPEIWSYGLRNPWRFSFDRLTGALLLSDVGQGQREEVNFETADTGGRGDNFGWNCREGLIPFSTPAPACTGQSGFTDPIFDYPHANPGGGAAFGCSITGGYVVRDPSLGDLYGRYIYADYCQGQLRSLLPGLPSGSGDRSEGLSVASPTSFGQDACGRIYVASNNGPVYRLGGSSTSPCPTLAVRVAGPGTVTGPGIRCPGDCQETYPQPQVVALSALANGSEDRFAGWSGACSGGASGCNLQVDRDLTVTATFEALGGPPARAENSLRLSALKRVVEPGSRARLLGIATPCDRIGDNRAILRRNGKPHGSRVVGSDCKVVFHPRIGRAWQFRLLIRGDGDSVKAISNRVRIRPVDNDH